MSITYIVVAICVVIGVIITKTLVTWLGIKTESEDFNTLYQWILIGCKAADQLVKSGQLTKEERKQHVIDFLQENGFLNNEEYDLSQIIEIIESICLDLPSLSNKK